MAALFRKLPKRFNVFRYIRNVFGYIGHNSLHYLQPVTLSELRLL